MKKILDAYAQAASKATRALYRNWILVLASLGAFFVFNLVAGIFGGSGFAGGMLVGLAQLVMLSLYYSWLSEALRHNKLSVRELYQIDYGLFINLINVAFIIFIATFLFDLGAQGSQSNSLSVLVRFLIFMVFNAIPETVYLHRLDGLNALGYAANFTRTNWIAWFVPMAITLLPVMSLSSQTALLLLAKSDPFLPALTVLPAVSVLALYAQLPEFVTIVVSVLLANWFMLFRGFLFERLDLGSSRYTL